MKLQTYFKASAAPAVLGLALLAQPAMAQDSDEGGIESAATADAPAPGQSIVVTGSRIQNPNLEQASPVAVVTAEELSLQQANTA